MSFRRMVKKLQQLISSALKGKNTSLSIALTIVGALLPIPLYVVLLWIIGFMIDRSDGPDPNPGQTWLMLVFYIGLILVVDLLAAAVGLLVGRFERKKRAFLALVLIASGTGIASMIGMGLLAVILALVYEFLQAR